MKYCFKNVKRWQPTKRIKIKESSFILQQIMENMPTKKLLADAAFRMGIKKQRARGQYTAQCVNYTCVI